MLNIFKSRKVKSNLSAAISFILILTTIFTSISMLASANEMPEADPIMPVEYETTQGYIPGSVGYTESLTEPYYNPKEQPVDANLEAKLRDALTAVKKVIEIDEKIYTTFNYDYYPGDDYTAETWYFSWASSDYRSSININVTGEGRITHYNKYKGDDSDILRKKNITLAKISKIEAKNKADAFIKKLIGDEFDGYKLYSQELSYPSESYYLYYTMTNSGYDYNDFILYVGVDKITGEVLNYSNHNNIGINNAGINYEDSSEVITKEEALNSYLDNVGLELIYTSRFDWQTRELKVYPVYRLQGNYNEYISAVTGELIKINNDNIYAMNAGGSVSEESPAMDSGRNQNESEVSFSPAELEKLENLKNYITAERAIEIMAEAFDLNLDDISKYQQNTSLSADYMFQTQYLWNIYLYSNDDTYESYNAVIDAKNGTILSYSNYSNRRYREYIYNPDGTIKGYVQPEYIYTYDEAKEIIIKKITELCPYDLDGDFEFIENEEYEADAKSFYYYFNFIRTVNGIRFEDNSIYVHFDNTTGKITNYNFRWYEDVKFPKLDNIVTPETALKNIADYVGYNIYYTSNGLTEDSKINAVLIYRFDGNILADPYTGKCIDWDYNEVTSPDTLPNYKDLDGHWSEDIVNTLTDNGIYVWGGEKFDPEKEITKGEFVKYLQFYTYNSYYFTDVSSSIFVNPYYYNNNIEKYDKDLDKILTKQEAAKIICEIAGYGELGKHNEIFAYPFLDDNCDDEYKGYVAIIKAFGLILGDDNGNFNGREVLTRSCAAAMVYNIVTVFNK